MATAEKEQVIKAVRDLKLRVTPADVAAKTGLPMHVVTSQLNSVASDTGGHLEVATTGNIAYRFPSGFQNAYLAKGFQKFLKDFGETAFKIGFFILRISFGIMLILSLLMVVLLIFVIMMRSGGGGRDDDRDSFHFGFFDYLLLRDLFYWGAYSAYGDPYQRRRKSKSNFLLNCFSFLFGDGNPNADLEERKWQHIAQAIRNYDGVVTAEQLAPFTGTNPTNEDGVLPVLVRFDGRPEVTETGNIVYVFPSLKVTTGDMSASGMPSTLREYPWKFSNAPADSLVPVYILAGVNFLGSWWVFFHLLHTTLAPLATVLVLYGTFFLVIPFVRWLWLKQVNGRIDSRNQARQAYARVIEEPTPAVIKKLSEARQFKVADEVIRSDNLVYTTEKDADEQDLPDELVDRFKELEKGKEKD